MPFALFTLFLAAFCIGTTEFVVAGVLPDISKEFGVSVPTAGYLISVYAFGVAIGGPIMTIVATNFPRKRNLQTLLALFVIGHAICAVAPQFMSLMTGRLIISLSHGSFYGIASVVAISLVPPQRRGFAISFLFAGISLATILGVPAGTAIGTNFGWRATFLVVGGAALIVALAITLSIPDDAKSGNPDISLGAQLCALANEKVLMSYLVFGVMQIGFWSFFTFIATFLIEGPNAAKWILPYVLLAFGTGCALGSVIGGRLADWNPRLTLSVSFPAQALVFVALSLNAENLSVVSALLFLLGVTIFLPSAAIVNRILTHASATPDLASTLVSTAANAGIGLGPIVGMFFLSRGHGFTDLPWMSAALSLTAAGLMIFSLGRKPRGVPRFAS